MLNPVPGSIFGERNFVRLSLVTSLSGAIEYPDMLARQGMSGRHRNMVMAGNDVTFLAKREDVKNSFTEKCENCMTWESSSSTWTRESKCGARGQHGIYRIFEAPILAKFRNRSCREIKCEKLRQFLDTECREATATH